MHAADSGSNSRHLQTVTHPLCDSMRSLRRPPTYLPRSLALSAGVGGVGEGVTAVGLAAMASSPASTVDPPQPIGQSGGDAPRGTWIGLTNFLWFRAEFRFASF